jgi:hypothetical protein
MIAKLYDSIFGCRHNRYSFPLTIHGRSRSRAAALTGTYVACLDCGKELPYDWDEMKVVGSRQARRNTLNSLATKQAA